MSINDRDVPANPAFQTEAERADIATRAGGPTGIGHVRVTQATSIGVTLNREDLERALLQWVESREPLAKNRDQASVTFNTNDDGEVTGAMIDLLCPNIASER